MTPAQRAAARTAHTEAVHELKLNGSPLDLDEDRHVMVDVAERFMRHTEALVGHLALALGPPDSPGPEWEFVGTIEHGKLIDPDGNEVHPFDGLRMRVPDPDPFVGLTGPEAVGASEPPPALHPTEGPTP